MVRFLDAFQWSDSWISFDGQILGCIPMVRFLDAFQWSDSWMHFNGQILGYMLMVRFLDVLQWSDSWMHSYSQILFIDEDILGLITPVSKTLPCVSKYALCCPLSCAFCPASTWLRFARNAFQVPLRSTWNAKIL